MQKTLIFANFNSSPKYHCTWPPKPLTGQFQHRLKQQNTKRQIHGNKIILMMLGMQILHLRKNPPPRARDLGEAHIFSTKDPKTLETYRFWTPSTACPKIAVPKAFGFNKRFRRKTKLRTAICTLDWRRRIFSFPPVGFHGNPSVSPFFPPEGLSKWKSFPGSCLLRGKLETRKLLGVDSQFQQSCFSKTSHFPRVFGGFLERRITGKNGEGTLREGSPTKIDYRKKGALILN